MSIAFYKVHNSQDYTPTKLEGLGKEELLEKLNLLQEDELVVYDLDNPEDVIEFNDDFNRARIGDDYYSALLG